MHVRKTLVSLACAAALSAAALPLMTHTTPAVGLHHVHAAVSNRDINAQSFANPQITTYPTTFTKYFGYRNGVGRPEGIVIHETANSTSTIDNEVAYMQRAWPTLYAYVHAFVDHSRIINIHPTDYGVWGAGPAANARFIQLELVREHSDEDFAASINNYAYYVAYLLKQYGMGVDLADNDGAGTIWSHNAVSDWLGGTDHMDPIGYFKQWGYDMNQFAALVQQKYDVLSDDGGGNNNGNGANPGQPIFDTVANQQSVDLLGVINGTATNGKYYLTDAGFIQAGTSASENGNAYRITQQATTTNGTSMYLMANASGTGQFWVISSILSTEPRPAAAPAITRNQNVSGTLRLTSSAILHSQPGDGTFLKGLSAGSNWSVYKQATLSDGSIWYNLGGNQWVAGNKGTFNQASTPPPATGGGSSVGEGEVTDFRAVAQINYVPNYGVVMWTGAGRVIPGRVLKHGTRWAVFEAKKINGQTYYNLGGDQWLQGKYVIIQ
jgi:hypothetical protein